MVVLDEIKWTGPSQNREELIAMLKPMVWPKVIRGGDCNGNTFKF